MHGPKDTPGGGFRSPPPGPPLQTTQRGGCGPLFGNSPGGAAAGRETERFDKHPRNLKKRHSLRHKRGWRGALQRTRMELGKSAESWLSAVASPNLPRRASLDEKRFSFGPCTARFLWQDQRGPRENPAKRFSWGEEKEAERYEPCHLGGASVVQLFSTTMGGAMPTPQICGSKKGPALSGRPSSDSKKHSELT